MTSLKKNIGLNVCAMRVDMAQRLFVTELYRAFTFIFLINYECFRVLEPVLSLIASFASQVLAFSKLAIQR